MLKKIGFSSAALFAMLTCIQPAALLAQDRDDARYDNRYAEQRNVRDCNEYRDRSETLRRDRDDRDRDDRDRDDRDRDSRDRDRNWTRRRDNDDWYRDNSFRR